MPKVGLPYFYEVLNPDNPGVIVRGWDKGKVSFTGFAGAGRVIEISTC